MVAFGGWFWFRKSRAKRQAEAQKRLNSGQDKIADDRREKTVPTHTELNADHISELPNPGNMAREMWHPPAELPVASEQRL